MLYSQTLMNWKYTPLKNVDHDIGWNDLSCWASVFYLVAHGFSLPLSLSDCFIIDSVFYPLFKVNNDILRKNKSFLRYVDRMLQYDPVPSPIRVLEPFIKHQQWDLLINEFARLGINFVKTKLNDMSRINNSIPFMAFVNTIYLPYWGNDLLLTTGGLYKYHHCLLTWDSKEDSALVQDPALNCYEGKLSNKWLYRSISKHDGMPASHEGKVLKFCYDMNFSSSRFNHKNIKLWRTNLINKTIDKIKSATRPKINGQSDLKKTANILYNALKPSKELNDFLFTIWLKQQLTFALIGYDGFSAIINKLGIDSTKILASRARLDNFIKQLNFSSNTSAKDIRLEFNTLFGQHQNTCLWFLNKVKQEGVRNEPELLFVS